MLLGFSPVFRAMNRRQPFWEVVGNRAEAMVLKPPHFDFRNGGHVGEAFEPVQPEDVEATLVFHTCGQVGRALHLVERPPRGAHVRRDGRFRCELKRAEIIVTSLYKVLNTFGRNLLAESSTQPCAALVTM